MNAEAKNNFVKAVDGLRKARSLFDAFKSGEVVSSKGVEDKMEEFIASLMPFINEAVKRYNDTQDVKFSIVDFEIELKRISLLSVPVDGILIIVKKFVDKNGKEPTIEEFTRMVYEDYLHKEINETFRPIMQEIFERWGINVPLIEVSTFLYFNGKAQYE